jgi:homoserine acetyltransferase
MGGMQALSLASLVPGLFRRVLVICTTGKTSPSTAALRYVQRTALRQALSSGAPPATALDAARLVGMLAYRTRGEFDARFEWGANADAVFECEGYMHQAAVRFRGVYDVHCYLAMSKLMDLMDLDALARGWDDHERHDGHGHLHEHDYENPHAQNHNNRGHGTENGRGHGPAASTGRRLRLWGSHRLLASSPQTELYMIGIKEDALIPVTEMGALAEELGPRFARRMQFDTVTSQHGHDAFLTQPSAFRNQISHFLDAGVASGTEEVRRYCKSVDA